MRQEIKGIITRLERVSAKVEDYLDNANNQDNPSEERIALLEQEFEAIQQAIEVLQEID